MKEIEFCTISQIYKDQVYKIHQNKHPNCTKSVRNPSYITFRAQSAQGQMMHIQSRLCLTYMMGIYY